MRTSKVAFIWPSDGMNDDEYWSYLPPGVLWLTNRFSGVLEGHELDCETFEASAELAPMVRAAEMMRVVKPDVVALGDHAGSFIKGAEFATQQIHALAKAADSPYATTPMTAINAALDSLNVKRIALTSPYDSEVTRRGIIAMEASGFDVVNVERRSMMTEHEIEELGAHDWLAAAVEADTDDAEALVLFGGGIRTAGMLPELVFTLGKPVIPATTALVWHACALTSSACLPVNAGTLHYLPMRDNRRIDHKSQPNRRHDYTARLRQYMSSATKSFSVSDEPPVFSGASGSVLLDTQGKHYIDLACGSGTTVLGYAQTDVDRALHEQINTGITHIGPHFHTVSQCRYIESLLEVLPEPLNVVHPATNGTEAIEAALKAAMHFTGNDTFIAFEGSYHGRTIGALSVSHSRGKNERLGVLFPKVIHMPYATNDTQLSTLVKQIKEALANNAVAGIIVEPLQATAGMRLCHSSLLPTLRQFADAAGVPLILDEVFTGFARSGSLFMFEQYKEVVPDLLILAKAASGGVPGALVAGRADILKRWPAGVQSSTFQMHPLSAAASLTTLEVLKNQNLCQRALAIGDHIRERLSMSLLDLESVASIQGFGAMWGVQIIDEEGCANQPLTQRFRQQALANGLLTWECGLKGEVIGLVPSLTINDALLERACALLEQSIRQVLETDTCM